MAGAAGPEGVGARTREEPLRRRGRREAHPVTKDLEGAGGWSSGAAPLRCRGTREDRTAAKGLEGVGAESRAAPPSLRGTREDRPTATGRPTADHRDTRPRLLRQAMARPPCG